jgi:hypothetical protein
VRLYSAGKNGIDAGLFQMAQQPQQARAGNIAAAFAPREIAFRRLASRPGDAPSLAEWRVHAISVIGRSAPPNNTASSVANVRLSELICGVPFLTL